MSGQHTPGPWTVTSHSDGWRVTARLNGSNRARIATAHGMRGDDARLIAAAPDLLHLARKYASECGDCNGTGLEVTVLEDGSYGPDADCESCADIRAVIAKAEGRS